MWDFDKCFEHVVGVEGSFSNDKADRGGATMYGITHAELSRWRGYKVTVDEVRHLTIDEAKKIYKRNYWDEMKLDLIAKDERCLLLFDQGVNRGTATAIKQAQAVVGVQWDGKNGPITSKAVNEFDKTEFCRNYLKASITAYANICIKNNSQLVFLRGWLNRAYKLMDACWL